MEINTDKSLSNIDGCRSIPIVSLVWLSQIIRCQNNEGCEGDFLRCVDKFNEPNISNNCNFPFLSLSLSFFLGYPSQRACVFLCFLTHSSFPWENQELLLYLSYLLLQWGTQYLKNEKLFTWSLKCCFNRTLSIYNCLVVKNKPFVITFANVSLNIQILRFFAVFNCN